MLRIIGLTGGIACGKSTVAELMKERGVPVIDADELAREIVAPSEEALDRIVEAFGSDILDGSGQLDRRALGRIVFSDAGARAKLEAITHPTIAAKSQQRFAEIAMQGHELAIYEAALLVETGGYKAMSALIVVSASQTLQKERLLARDSDLTEAEAEQRIASQMPMAKKIEVADHVISNEGTLEDLATSVDLVLANLRDTTDG